MFFVFIFVAAAVISCSKENRNDNGMDLMKNAKDVPIDSRVASLPISDGDLSDPDDGVEPYIIPGANNGGNRTCAEVAAEWGLNPNPFLCGTKVDYSGDDFSSKFPSWLHVTVTDGTFVSFSMDKCAMINGKYYRVGAVIVKGSSDANVYYYPNGTLFDSGLASPVNASGAAAGLSNLTFCLIECKEQPNLVIALKTWFDNGRWACTSGGPENISFVGYYDFIPYHQGYKIYYTAETSPLSADLSKPVGNLMIADSDQDGFLDVTIDNSLMPDKKFTKASLFVGTLEDYKKSWHGVFEYQTGDIAPTPLVKFDLDIPTNAF